jgi:hypothetical protein
MDRLATKSAPWSSPPNLKQTYRELAGPGNSAGTLMARKKRAMEKIRRHLEKHGPELRHHEKEQYHVYNPHDSTQRRSSRSSAWFWLGSSWPALRPRLGLLIREL